MDRLSRLSDEPTPDLQTQWDTLPEESRVVLAAVVVHEGSLSGGWLAQITPSARAVDPLVSEGWLTEIAPNEWALNPGVDRASLRHRVSWSQRREAHEVLGRLLADRPDHYASAAAHFAAAGSPAEAGRLWLAAAREQCRRQPSDRAAEYFRHAVDQFPPGLSDDDLVMAVREFGTCAALHHSTEAALELIRRWRTIPILAERWRFQAEAARVHAATLVRAQRHVESAHVRRHSAEMFDRCGAAADAATELLAAATTLAYALHLSSAEEAASRAMAKADHAGRPEVQTEARILRGFCLGMRGETARAREEVEAALDEALRHGLTSQAANAYRILGNVREYASCYHEVPQAFARALSYCRRHGEVHVADLCVGCLSYSLFRAGNWRQCTDLLRQILNSKQSADGSRSVARGVLGLLQVLRGELKPAGRNLGAAIEAARTAGITGMELICLAGEALAQEFSGASEHAAGIYRRIMDLWLTTEDRHDVVLGFIGAVSFFARRGERAAAAEFAVALQTIAAMNPNPESLGASLVAAAELKLLDGKPTEAAATFLEAIKTYEQRGLQIEMIRAQLRLGRAWEQAGETARANEVLHEAKQRAIRLGARSLAAQAGSVGSVDAMLRRSTAGGSELSLSPRQRDVARHLSAGRTNKEIAQALCLSVRTVDMHVAHVLARLDCRTRAAAAARLATVN